MGFTARILLVLALGAAPLAAQVSAPASARELWDLYVELGTGFDPALGTSMPTMRSSATLGDIPMVAPAS